MTTPDPQLERKIAGRFEAIADVGWFNQDVPPDFPQLKLVREVLSPRPGQRVLDAGCARGRFLRGLQSTQAKLYGVDLTAVFARDAQRNVPNARVSQASLSALPFAANTFDAAYCVEVLQHLPNTELALRELARVLKPGGKLLIIDKSLQGLDPGTGLPNWLVKPWAERKGKWMYPPDFPFRERWFWPSRTATLLRRIFPQVQTRYLPEGRGKASHFYRLVPFLSIDVAWIASKGQ